MKATLYKVSAQLSSCHQDSRREIGYYKTLELAQKVADFMRLVNQEDNTDYAFSVETIDDDVVVLPHITYLQNSSGHSLQFVLDKLDKNEYQRLVHIQLPVYALEVGNRMLLPWMY